MSRYYEKQVCITGIGSSAFYRKPTVYPFDLALKACEAAVADAGLALDEIDGLACWPYAQSGQGSGNSSASPTDIKNAFGLKLNWYSSGDGPAQFASIANAIGAIAAGYCDHVLCWRAEGERWVPTYGRAYQDGSMPSPGTGWMQWSWPYWAISAANWIALHADDHMRRSGITREQMGQIPITQRKAAALNPRAVYREPLTLDQYLSARMVTTPFTLFDCDVPVDGTIAVVLSRRDLARATRKPISIEAIGTALHGMDSWYLREDWPNMAMHDAAQMLWSRTDLKPKDVTSAHLYDGFTYLAILWLEALGLKKFGETGAFLEGGQRIGLTGELPLNTNGGQLSEGRLHAFGHLYEAVEQLRGEAGARQLKRAELAAVAAGGGIYGSCLLLRR